MRVGRAVSALVVAVALAVLPTAAAGADAAFHGSMGGVPLNGRIVAMAATPSGGGYWLVGADGGVFAFGDARFAGSLGDVALNAPIVAMAATPSGEGYWLVAADGGVFAFGDARFAGSLGDVALNAAIVGMAATPSGEGYWLVAADGGVFAFGDAPFLGSLGHQRLSSAVTALASHPGGDGYWLATADGRVFSFGSAEAVGSAEDLDLRGPITDLLSTGTGAGYWLASTDGGVFAFGDARFHGSVGGSHLGAEIVDLAAPAGGGYWLAAADGGVFALPGPAPPAARTPTLEVTTVVDGLTVPWDLAFLPDDTMIFTERPGRISAVVDGRTRVLAVPPDVRAVGEGGMLGLALDPGFASNRLLYTCYNSTAGDVRVVRWRLDHGLTTLERRGDVVTGIPAAANGRHSGCRLEIGPDGFLWVTTGDATIASAPQDIGSLAGKVLRIDPDTGEAAPGNPFGNRVWTFGHRNPQGLAFRPTTTQVFAVEHGAVGDDEVNVLVAGANYGWDPGPGYDEAVPMTDTDAFPDARLPVWSSGSARIAPSGGAFLSGPQWGTWNGAFVFAALRGQQLRLLFLTADGSVQREEFHLTGFGRLRAPVLGPEGDLYLTTSNGPGADRILRVSPR